MYVRLTDHYIKRWHERVGSDKVKTIQRRLKHAIRRGPLFGQGDGTFIVQVGRGKYAIVSMDSLGWTGITLFVVRPPLKRLKEGGMDNGA
jgi:hypothetical protein